MTPMMLQPGDGEGGGESSGVRRMPIDKPQTPPGFYAPPPSDVDLGEEEQIMATAAERLGEVEKRQTELAELGHRLEVGQETARGERALQAAQIQAISAQVAEIPAIKETQAKQGAEVAQCNANTVQILAILKGNGMVAPTAADAVAGVGGSSIVAAGPSHQMGAYFMRALNQVPGPIALIVVVYLLLNGKVSL